jgi:hypothetical protein
MHPDRTLGAGPRSMAPLSSLALALALALAAGCSSSSSGPVTTGDASTDDTSTSDTSTGDTATGDTAAGDSSTGDTATGDTALVVCAKGQIDGDCHVFLCDGAGTRTTIDDATDVPASTTACQQGVCSGTPLKGSLQNAPLGASCAADGMFPRVVCGDPTDATVGGVCVECNRNADCTGGFDGGFGGGDGGVSGCFNHTCL